MVLGIKEEDFHGVERVRTGLQRVIQKQHLQVPLCCIQVVKQVLRITKITYCGLVGVVSALESFADEELGVLGHEVLLLG